MKSAYCIAALLLFTACEAPSSKTDSNQPTLALGDRGAQVQGAYAYLKRYGYFPNSELERAYPGFKPLVAEAPPDPSLYDDKMAEAVRLFQANVGLEATGELDERTRAEMSPRECGFPDGYALPQRDHGAEKFAVNSTNLSRTTWSVENWPVGATEQQVITATAEMIAEWQRYHRHTFTRVARGQGQIKIRFAYVDGRAKDNDNDNDNDCTHPSINPNTVDEGCEGGFGSTGSGITLDEDERWEFVGTTSTAPRYNDRRTDYRTVLLHEFGHVLGLYHSAFTTSVMYYKGTKGSMRRSLTPDDTTAIRSGSALFSQNPTGWATDVHAQPPAAARPPAAQVRRSGVLESWALGLCSA